MEEYLKQWRNEALDKHQYDSAIYIGDKLLAITCEKIAILRNGLCLQPLANFWTADASDALWLAQVHFSARNYPRALDLLEQHHIVDHNPSCRYLAANCLLRQGKYDDALILLGDRNPTHLILSPSKARRKLQHQNGSMRLAPKAATSSGRSDRIERSEERERESMSDIKCEAAMCHLRGLCFAKQTAMDRAIECYKDAVAIDVQCFEAFEQLMKNKLMSPDEEWSFIESLDFESIEAPASGNHAYSAQEAAQFTKMLYTTRLSKYKNPAVFVNATENLSSHYNLAENADILHAKADLLFTQCRFNQSLAITTSILSTDPHNFAVMPLHLASLNELNRTNTLFLLSHKLADSRPDEPATWLAVGVYYLSISQVAEARRFFSKASMMDPHFGPAWIGFAHTFAAEGEHDQAISAYSTAAGLYQGTHLPPLFLGMQHLCLGNPTLAHQYLTAAFALCGTDPLLLNEMGVVLYHLDHLKEAVAMFTGALQMADQIESDPQAWVATRANLAHAYRRQQHFGLALQEFDEVLRQGGPDAGIFSARGLVLLELGRTWEAVCAFHEALGVQPQDPVATDLLSRALEENALAQGWNAENEGDANDGDGGGHEKDQGFESLIDRAKRELEAKKAREERGKGKERRGRFIDERGSIGAVEDDSMMVMSDGE